MVAADNGNDDKNSAQQGHTRKLTAILAADVAGYSRLMADDEGATVNTLTAYREVFQEHVQSHKGRIVDTAGDSVLATFESVVEAVEAAVEIQRDLTEANEALQGHRKMHFRIGVNLGDIIVREDGTIYGDGVNVAARLESLAEPGGVMVSEDAYRQVEGKLGVALEDAGEHEVKNIAKPVGAYRVLLDGSDAATVSVGRPRERKGALGSRPKLVASLVAVLAVVVGVAVWGLTIRVEAPQMVMADGTPTDDPVLAMPFGPAIAVLPFSNMSGDPEDEYFADGLSEDILTRLSQFDGLRVIARTSSFEFKGQDLDVREIGKRLDARYILEGSVRRGADDVRITAQLLSSIDGGHLWAKSYDRELDAAAIFKVQDEISNDIAATLGDVSGIIVSSEMKHLHREAPASLSSYECVLLAKYYQANLGPENHLAAWTCLEEVVQRDPDYSDAWAWLSLVNIDSITMWNTDRVEGDPLEIANFAARRALELDPENQQALKVLALREFWLQNAEGFLTDARRAIAINPNNAEALAELGMYSIHAGFYDWGVGLLEKAIATTPNPPRWYFQPISLDLYRKREYQEALTFARKSVSGDNPYGYVALALAHGQLGNNEDALEASRKLKELRPDYADRDNVLADFELWTWAHPEVLLHWMEGLEKAGLFDEPEAPSRPVIAVLPFTNMSGAPEQEYFADGITEDIITRLARFPDIGVIARNSSFQYKGKNVDIRTVAEELGATYVLEGSIRRSDNDIRVTAQLLNAVDGTHLWAEAYDRDLSAGSLFEIQDNVTERVVGAIASGDSVIALAVVSSSEAKAPAELASYECVLRTIDYWRVITPDVHLQARNCLEHVVANDSEYAAAFAYLAHITIEELLYGYNPKPEEAPPLDRAMVYAQRAIDIDPKSATSHWALARTAFYQHNLGIFRSETERALELAPNDTFILALAGLFMSYTGSWERGLSLLQRAIELNPHHQTWYHLPYFYNAYRLGQNEAALAAAQRINMPGFFWIHQVYAAAYAQSGMADEAAEAVTRLLELYPGYSIQTMTEMHLMWNFEEDVIERMADGLRKAGLPEVSG